MNKNGSDLKSQFKRETIHHTDQEICLYSRDKKAISVRRLKEYLQNKGWYMVNTKLGGLEEITSKDTNGIIIGCKADHKNNLKKLLESKSMQELNHYLEKEILGICYVDSYSDWDYDQHMYQEDAEEYQEMAKENLKPQAIDFLYNSKSFYYLQPSDKNRLSLEFTMDVYLAIGIVKKCMELDWEEFKISLISE